MALLLFLGYFKEGRIATVELIITMERPHCNLIAIVGVRKSNFENTLQFHLMGGKKALVQKLLVLDEGFYQQTDCGDDWISFH